MHISISIHPIEENGQDIELYYKMLAKKIGEHIDEIASLGNMDTSMISGIYREIANAIDIGHLDKENISSDIGAKVIKAGFLNSMPDVNFKDAQKNAALAADFSLAVIVTENTQNRLVRDFWNKVERIPELAQIKMVGEKIQMLSNNHMPIKYLATHFVAALETIAKITPSAVVKLQNLAQDGKFKIVEDKLSYMIENAGYFDADNRWDIQDKETGIPIFSWGSLITENFTGYSFGKIVKQLFLANQKDAIKKALTSIEALPDFVKGDTARLLFEKQNFFVELETFKCWFGQEHQRGVARKTIMNKMKTDFSALAMYPNAVLDNMLQMFSPGQVVKRQHAGKITYFWGEHA